jgi:hypothetical protein
VASCHENGNNVANSRYPKFYLTIKDKDNNKSRTLAGALFETEYGYSLKLNPGVVLRWDDNVFFNINKPNPDYKRGRSEVEVLNPDGVQYGDEREADIDDEGIDLEDLGHVD